MWYLPYFVTSQAKKRIVYDGRAEFDGVCVNEFIETEPDLSNSLADVLARFRLEKLGMMANLTKCFFQIGLPEDQRDLFRILWFDNNNGVASVSIVFGRSNVVLRHQESWPIARKELVAALTTTELSRQAFEALGLPGCERYFWCDSRNVLQWIKNKDLCLDRFISRRVEKILLLSKPTNWRYCAKSLNPADVAFRPDGVKKPEARRSWYERLDFVKQNVNEPVIESPSVSVKRVAWGLASEELYFPDNSQLDKLIESFPSLYVLTKRVAYLAAFVDYIGCKVKNCEFVLPRLDTCDLDMALNRIIGFLQRKCNGQALSLMRSNSPESLTDAIEKCGRQNSGQP